jgi:hypothetical protein
MKSGIKNSLPLRVKKWIDLDQSPKRAIAKFKRGRGNGPQKETPTEIGASRYCWQLALNADPPVTKRV